MNGAREVQAALRRAVRQEVDALHLSLSVVERQELEDALEAIALAEIGGHAVHAQLAHDTLNDIIARHQAQASWAMMAALRRIALAVAKAGLGLLL